MLAGAAKCRRPRRSTRARTVQVNGEEPRQAGGGPNTSTALRPPNANEFDIV